MRYSLTKWPSPAGSLAARAGDVRRAVLRHDLRIEHRDARRGLGRELVNLAQPVRPPDQPVRWSWSNTPAPAMRAREVDCARARQLVLHALTSSMSVQVP